MLLGHFSQFEVGLFFFLKGQLQQFHQLVLTQGLRQRDVGSIGSNLVVLDPLHAGNNHQVHDRPLAILVADLMVGFLDKTPHRLAHLAAGPDLKFLHCLLEPLDLDLGLLDVHLHALAQRRRRR